MSTTICPNTITSTTIGNISIGNTTISSEITFYSDSNKEVGKINFASGVMIFEGNIEESSQAFFQYLKGTIDSYINSIEPEIKRMRKQEKFLSRLGIDMSFLDEEE